MTPKAQITRKFESMFNVYFYWSDNREDVFENMQSKIDEVSDSFWSLKLT